MDLVSKYSFRHSKYHFNLSQTALTIYFFDYFIHEDGAMLDQKMRQMWADLPEDPI